METVLTIHVDLPAELSKEILKAKRAFNLYYKSQESFDPHITCYLAGYSRSGFAALVRDLRSFRFKSFTARLTPLRFESWRDDVFISFGVEPRRTFMNFHRVVLRTANRHRRGIIRKKDLWRITEGKCTKQEARYIKQYGYMRVLKLFKPHVTLGEAGREDANIIMKKLKKRLSAVSGKKFSVGEIIVRLYAFDSKKNKYSGILREASFPLR